MGRRTDAEGRCRLAVVSRELKDVALQRAAERSSSYQVAVSTRAVAGLRRPSGACTATGARGVSQDAGGRAARARDGAGTGARAIAARDRRDAAALRVRHYATGRAKRFS